MTQISGTAIETKFAPPYACVFMDKVEREFLEADDIKPWVWLRHIDDIFFIWTEGANKLESFLQRFNTFHPNLKFTHEKSKTSINCHQFLEFNSAHPIHIKKSIV